ncbi:MAG TPA: class II aldolase/adducin family protein, partial [Feifaniaceae bacterium]|nr:class II aldolase/adducin family protein [Feifaniaceae bacterium]
DYVQGGGGNTSVKLQDGLMAIKASGYRLSDVGTDSGYAVLDYEALRTFYFSHGPEEFEDVEKRGSEEAKAAVRSVEGLKELRPSVEAGFHSVLPTFVLHTHSVYGNLAACAAEGREIVKQAFADAPYTVGFVPYTDPGARLTFTIRDECARVEQETGKAPSVIFMQNHGPIVMHDDSEVCARIHADANGRVAKAFKITGESFPKVKVKAAENGMVESDTPYLKKRLKECGFTEKFLIEKPLYPDQMVFFVGTLTVGGGTPGPDACVCDMREGAVRYNMPESKALVIEETLTAVLFITEHIAKSGYTLSTMGEAARNFIANWESEKYRKSLAGK